MQRLSLVTLAVLLWNWMDRGFAEETLIETSFYGRNVSTQQFEFLPQNSIYRIWIEYDIGSVPIDSLKRFSNLRSLRVDSATITASQYQTLMELPRLRSLDVSRSRVSFHDLIVDSSVEQLSVRVEQLSDVPKAVPSSIKSLSIVFSDSSDFSREIAEKLALIPRLEEIHVECISNARMPIPLLSLRSLSQLIRLRAIKLKNCRFNLSDLEAFGQLDSLSLTNCYVQGVANSKAEIDEVILENCFVDTPDSFRVKHLSVSSTVRNPLNLKISDGILSKSLMRIGDIDESYGESGELQWLENSKACNFQQKCSPITRYRTDATVLRRILQMQNLQSLAFFQPEFNEPISDLDRSIELVPLQLKNVLVEASFNCQECSNAIVDTLLRKGVIARICLVEFNELPQIDPTYQSATSLRSIRLVRCNLKALHKTLSVVGPWLRDISLEGCEFTTAQLTELVTLCPRITDLQIETALTDSDKFTILQSIAAKKGMRIKHLITHNGSRFYSTDTDELRWLKGD